MAPLEACYILETDGGDRIYVHNDAIRTAPARVMARLLRGEPFDPGHVYFRCVPRFEASAPALRWISDYVFVGVRVRRPSRSRCASSKCCSVMAGTQNWMRRPGSTSRRRA